ncbi:hypothetical protein QO004_004771 [Rhizobium mesoamericanum]|nr:hypothetical protein [Rhizobium mesoamericanum]
MSALFQFGAAAKLASSTCPEARRRPAITVFAILPSLGITGMCGADAGAAIST